MKPLLLAACFLYIGGLAQAAGVFDVSIIDDGRNAGTAQGYASGKTTFVNASEACRALKGQPYWYQVSGRVFCSMLGKKVLFSTHKSKAHIGDKEVGLESAVTVRGGQAFVPLSFFLSKEFSGFLGRTARYDAEARVIEYQRVGGKKEAASTTLSTGASSAAAATSAKHRIKIVIDPGHGGKDPGTSARGLREKDLVLSISRELAGLLKDSGEFDVRLTRDTDVFIPLDKRSEIANEFAADLFVSIHVNYNESSHEKGMEVYFLSEKASNTEAALVAQLENSVLGLQEKKPQDMEAAMILSEMEKTELINDSALLAGYVAKAVDKKVDVENRGVKQAQFFVLHWARSPAILVETAFVSNAKDAAKLASQAFRRKLAEAVFDGIRAYAKKKEWL
jgi:N-acetylmuramoyl-L-alanine amidase